LLSVGRLAIDKDFLGDYSKLPKPVQNSVKMAIDRFAEHVHAGLHLEKLTRRTDERIRTIRVDRPERSRARLTRSGSGVCGGLSMPEAWAARRSDGTGTTLQRYSLPL
jgi:hypothetical protein